MTINRRQFFLATLSTAAAIAVPELWVPKRTIFLPPRGGWFQTPLVRAVQEYADLARPVGVLVNVRLGTASYAKGAAAFTVTEHFGEGAVEIAVARDIPWRTEKIIREAARAQIPWGTPPTIGSLVPARDKVAVEFQSTYGTRRELPTLEEVTRFLGPDDASALDEARRFFDTEGVA